MSGSYELAASGSSARLEAARGRRGLPSLLTALSRLCSAQLGFVAVSLFAEWCSQQSIKQTREFLSRGNLARPTFQYNSQIFFFFFCLTVGLEAKKSNSR